MRTPARTVAALLVACVAAVAPARVRADMGRSCVPRELDATERAAAARVVSAIRAALPGPPDGWSVRDDVQQSAAGSCEAEGTKRLVAQPISVIVARTYAVATKGPATLEEAQALLEEAQAKADAAVVEAKAQADARARAAEAGAPANARRKALEAELAELQRRDREGVAEYQAARRTGDRAGQESGRKKSQEARLAMRPAQQELAALRSAEREARASASQASTAAAVAKLQAAERNRPARLSVAANQSQLQLRGAERIAVAGTRLALRQRGRTILLLGDWSWDASGWALAKLDETGSTARVQTLVVEIDADETTGETLRGGLDVASLARLLAR